MLGTRSAVLLITLAVVSAYPANDPVITKFDPNGARFDYLEDDSGQLHLVDNWMKLSDLEKVARYNPAASNRYHLFTRANPSISQPLVLNNFGTVSSSNFNARRRTIVLMHGFAGSVTSGFNTVLVPAFLAAQDVNVIVLDWSAGSHYGPLAIQAGQAAGRFFTWLNSVTGATPNMYHMVGYSVGGHGVSHIARTVSGNVGYVTGLDPADRWDSNQLFRANDAIYTEIIHTNAGNIGIVAALAHVDFYPNGGRGMPGCQTALCDHYRSYYYLAESVRTGGFTGRQCSNVNQALAGTCTGGSLRMGGINPKTGGLDPADRWDSNQLFRANDAIYTEIIHTNAGNIGIVAALAHVDFYPNGGRGMPGCQTALCDHYRSYYYLAESVRTGGFTGRQCSNVNQALAGTCTGGSLRMGGINPKTGSRGIYHLVTNPMFPFSRG